MTLNNSPTMCIGIYIDFVINKLKANLILILYTYAHLWIYNLSLPVSWRCTRSCFSLTVYDVLTLNPLDVGCVMIDNLVLDA